MNKTISIVIPALNEEKGIGATIKLAPIEELGSLGYSVQILVVNNGSSDKTAELATEAGAEVIHIPVKGVGIAMKAGFDSAIGDIIVTSDGDGTYPLEKLGKLIRVFEGCEIDFLTTNRFGFIVDGAMPSRNKTGNKLLSLVLQTLFGLPIYDSQSGMMIVKKEILDKMILHPNISLPQEMKIEASYYLKCNYMEVPIRYEKRLGESKLGTNSGVWKMGISNMWNLFRKRVRRCY